MNAFNDFTFRFLQTIESMNLTDYKVWNTLENLSKATMSKIRRGVCGVSMNTLQEFLQAYPDVNANYILTGRGSMFLTSDMTQSDSEETEAVMKKLSDEVEMLRKENEELRKQLAEKARSA